MITKTVKMNTFIVDILEQGSFNSFNISKLKDAYMDLSKNNSSIESRKLVYKQVLKLVKLGGLIKEGNKHSHQAIYKKTDLFRHIVFTRTNQLAINSLESKLRQYKMDMLSSVSESEEYLKLDKYFPSMATQLKEKHQLASDNSFKLLGKIKAVNTLIDLQEEY